MRRHVVVGIALVLLALAGLILGGHIGLDRFLGYGLKYPSAFKDTHIQRM